MQQIGLQLSENLNSKFESSITGINQNVDLFEVGLREWEMGMMQDLTQNTSSFDKFKSDVGNSLEDMSRSVN